MRRPLLTSVVVLFGYLVLPMAMSGTAVALPRIGADLDASGSLLQWVMTGYFLSASSCMLVAGSAGDRFGRRRVYQVSAAGFAVSALASALAPSIEALAVARTLAGVAGGGVMAGGGAILGATFAGHERTRAFAAMGTTIGVGMATGPPASGWLVDAVGWRTSFAAFAIAGLILVVGAAGISESRADVRPHVEWLGTGVLIAGLALMMLAITRTADTAGTHPSVLVPLAAACVLMWVVARLERRGDPSVLDLGLLRHRALMGWALAAGTMAIGFGAMLTYLPSYLQGVDNLSSGRTGLIMLMATAPVLFAPPLSSWLVNQGVPARHLIVSALLMLALGNAALTVLHPGIDSTQLLAPLLTIGAGMGLGSGLVDAQALSTIHRDRVGMASGLLHTIRSGTMTLVLAAFGSLLVTLLTVRLGSAEMAARVAAGSLPPEERADLAGELTSAWRTLLSAIAALCLTGALAVKALLAPRR